MHHTYAEWKRIWETFTGGQILDPDGFREGEVNGVLDYVDVDKEYTLEEFHQKVGACTIRRGEVS